MERISVRTEDLPAKHSNGVESRSGELGAYMVSFDTDPAGFAVGRELLAGPPDDTCHCPHRVSCSGGSDASPSRSAPGDDPRR